MWVCDVVVESFAGRVGAVAPPFRFCSPTQLLVPVAENPQSMTEMLVPVALAHSMSLMTKLPTRPTPPLGAPLSAITPVVTQLAPWPGVILPLCRTVGLTDC